MVNYDCRFILVTADMELRSMVYCIQHIADYIALEDITSLCGLFGLMANIKRYEIYGQWFEFSSNSILAFVRSIIDDNLQKILAWLRYYHLPSQET